MNFRSIYQHGFARVASCTNHVAIADPPANADAVLAVARECHDEGVARRGLPRARACPATRSRTCCCRTRSSTRSRTRSRRWSRPPPPCCRCSSSARRCATATASTTAPSSSTAAGSSASRRSPTCRTTASSTSAASSRRATTSAAATIRVGDADVPFGPDLLFEAEDVPGLVVHVEVCEDMWVPVPPSAEAALAGATVLAEHLRQPDHHRPGRGPQAAVPVGRRRGASPPTCTPPRARASRRPTSRGTARRWSTRTASCSPRPSASPTARGARWPTSTSTCCARSACGWGPSTTTAAPTPRGRAGSAASRSRLDPPDDRPRPAPPARALPVRPRRPRPPRAGLLRGLQHPGRRASQQRLEAIGGPKVVIGVSGGLDSTHALLVAAQAMDRSGRPRSDILAFTLPGLRHERRTRRTTRTRSMRALGVTAQELDIRPTARADAAEIGHPYAAGEPVYDVTFENVQAGLRTDYLFRSPTSAAGSSSAPATCPSWRSAGRRTASATR